MTEHVQAEVTGTEGKIKKKNAELQVFGGNSAIFAFLNA